MSPGAPVGHGRWRLLLVLFAVSGACGLVYELVWMRRLALVFGSTTLAVSTVLAAFMGGLALGSYFFGRRAAPTSSTRSTPCTSPGTSDAPSGASARP